MRVQVVYGAPGFLPFLASVGCQLTGVPDFGQLDRFRHGVEMGRGQVLRGENGGRLLETTGGLPEER